MNDKASFATALAAYNAGRPGDAVRICQMVLQAEPNNADAAHLLGLILLQAGQAAAAVAPLRAAVTGKAGDVQIRIHLAEAVNGAAGPLQALDYFRAALLLAPESDLTTARIAELKGGVGDRHGAAGLARRSTIMAPVNPSHRYLHARCRAALNDVAYVERDIRRAALLLPAEVEVLRYLATVCAWRGDANYAGRVLRRLSRLVPNDPDVWRRLAVHQIARRLQDEAVPSIKCAIVLEPGAVDSWRSFMHIARDRQDSASALTVSRRYVVCNPGDAEALLYLATAEHALGNDARYRHVIDALESLAPRNPAVWQALALDRRDRGLSKQAGQLLDHYFKETASRLTAEPPDLVSDIGLVAFLTTNLIGGRYEAVRHYCEVARALPAANPRIDVEVFKCASVAGAAGSYSKSPVRWLTDNRLIVSVPVWGRKFADLWLKAGLASMNTPDNRRLWTRQETAFHIVSTRDTWDYLCTLKPFEALRERHHVCFLDIEPTLRAGYQATNYLAMTVAQWVSLCIAIRERASYLSLVADYVFSASAFAHLSDLLDRDAADVFYTIDFPVSDKAEDLLYRHQDEDGLLSISERSLADLFLNHPSRRVAHHDISLTDRTLPTDPSRLNVRLADGIQIRSMQPQLVYATSRALEGFWAPALSATDNGFADMVLPNLSGEERMMMLNDPERFGCAVLEVDEDTRTETGHFAKRRPIETDLAVELMGAFQNAGFLTRGRIWALRNPMNVMRDGVSSDTAATGFIDQIAAALPYAETDAVRQLMYDLGRPAFARFLESLPEAQERGD